MTNILSKKIVKNVSNPPKYAKRACANDLLFMNSHLLCLSIQKIALD